jgi:hypothetical protein
MSEVKSVIVVTAKPTGPGDPGQCEEGFYTVTGQLLTMTDREGRPLRDDNTGRRHEMKLLPGDIPQQEAKRMTLRIQQANRNEMAGFGRTIRYRDLGLP